MSVEKQYYLNCDGDNCDIQYEDKGETKECVREMAIDDGWGYNQKDELDFCPKCKKTK